MIIVTGATGQLGRQIVERLLARVPADRIGLSVRDPRKARVFAEQGVRVRRGDFADAGSLAHAFEGATQVLVTSVDRFGGEAVRQHRAAIGAAVAAGARRVLYTSHMGAGASSRFQACRDHAATEEVLRGCGVPYTALRNGFYAAAALQFLGQGPQSGEIALPADGAVSWTCHEDLAEAAAVILADEGCFEGATPPLTAGRAFGFDDVARVVGEVTGRAVSRSVVSDGGFLRQLMEHGVPGERAQHLLDVFLASRAGEFAAVDPALGRLLRREPLSLDTVLRKHLAAA
ncbi:NmrA family NAD(P)-binding protein [Nonomuraea gerenzanensis]|uniref:Oxidoreductase n=1 Tax=Nonomuraea gerenzanensis TaxID=93944 RepID=A0A1M4EFW5_9ACTN|nr:NAD(P)H-binding protein [Nonomuraea gerenzanensis]UBU09212.1 NAD(P)H-binding protein [Nonomuraea gerenzanensis]SBO97606.1 Oxidoreductase [Nonomuraea gerenzanensis]